MHRVGRHFVVDQFCSIVEDISNDQEDQNVCVAGNEAETGDGDDVGFRTYNTSICHVFISGFRNFCDF